jgi:hypothetical protein
MTAKGHATHYCSVASWRVAAVGFRLERADVGDHRFHFRFLGGVDGNLA